jgi:hypothetical protein
VSSPYRIPDPPPKRREPDADVSPAVVVVVVATVVMIVIGAHQKPIASAPGGIFRDTTMHFTMGPATHRHGRR